MSLAFPLITWGAGQAASLGSTLVTITPNQPDAFGGTQAILAADANVVAESYVNRFFAPTYSGAQVMCYLIKGNTSVSSTLRLWNQTQVVDHFTADVSWSGGVPTVTITGGRGTLLGVISLGAGWYLVLGLSLAGVVAGDQCYWLVNPAGVSPFSNTGSIYLDERRVVLLDMIANAVAWDQPRENSELVGGLDGTADAYLFPKDYRFGGDVLGIPSVARGTPLLVSGWDGENEAAGINCGLQAMLKAAMDQVTLTWVPDRSDCSTNLAVKLAKPGQGDAPTTRRNGDRGFSLELFTDVAPFPLPI